MSGTPQPPCLDCRQRRVGCHDPEICKAWAEYTAQAKVSQKQAERRRATSGMFRDYCADLHQRMERRKWSGH